MNSNDAETRINWSPLKTAQQLDELVEQSHTLPVVIFKHSTRCGVSSMAKSRLENSWDIPEGDIKPYLLDLISYRALSDEVARRFNVPHQSPQLLLIRDGVSVYDCSHMSISASALKKKLA